MCLFAPGATRDRVAGALRSTIVAPAAAMQARAEISRRSFLAEAVTRRFNDSVSLRSQRLTGVEDENARLRQLLGLAGAVKWGFVPAEILQGRSLGDEFTVTLTSGASAGVEPLSPLIVPEGLVGVVQRADPALSVAILWPHPDFRVSAMSADGATYGIVTSHQGPSADRYLLELRSVPLRMQLRPGTLIVSSGAGGVFPRNIPVGTVINELKTNEAWARTYLLRPAVKFADLGAVMVLTRAKSTQGVDGVWNLESLADSARRSVVAAGEAINARLRDSLVAPPVKP
ncbi:MAG: rod shape-determining protein MreC [bacterium]